MSRAEINLEAYMRDVRKSRLTKYDGKFICYTNGCRRDDLIFNSLEAGLRDPLYQWLVLNNPPTRLIEVGHEMRGLDDLFDLSVNY